MSETQLTLPELPNIVTFLGEKFRPWENVIFSLLIIAIISLLAYFAARKTKLVPSGLQNCAEVFAGGVDNFICGILGPKGRKYVPFIGTLFIYILVMNLAGLVPLFKSPTASWSTTMALALCVFIYVQYTALKEFGFFGYLDHLMGRPRGVLALSVFIPILMFFLHIISELVRPISLSLRLRGNILGDDLLMAVLSGLGLKGIPFLFFSSFIVIIASVVQALVFSLLTTIYFALVLTEEQK